MNAKRSLFRFHLQTAVVMMVAAGLAIWANFAWPERAVADLGYKRIVGFPCAFIGERASQTRILYGELALDIVFWIAVLSYVAFLSERFARRYDGPEP